MEAMQDKLIREKLNSLDSLPEGYAPSLDSKWELLRAGKPEKKKTPVYFWYAVAASLLLLLSFGLIFWQIETPVTENVPEKAVAKHEIPAEKTKPNTLEYSNYASQANSIKPAVASVTSTQKNGMVKAAKTIIPKQIAEISSIDATVKPATVTQTTEEEPVLIAAENSKITSKKKNRYVEVDFEAPETPQRLPQPVQTAQLQFKIRILPQIPEAGQTSAQAQNPLRLEHSF